MRTIASALLPILAIVLLAGCGPSATNDGAAASEATGSEDVALNAQPVKEEHKALVLTPQWLAGRWQPGDGNCAASDTSFMLEPDGGYVYMGEAGRWSLQGDALTIEVTQAGEDSGGTVGERHTNRVKAIGPNEVEFQADGADPIRLFRCHAQE
jgi:hypothetical protein